MKDIIPEPEEQARIARITLAWAKATREAAKEIVESGYGTISAEMMSCAEACVTAALTQPDINIAVYPKGAKPDASK